jgi:hypothetical protein
MKAAWWQVPSPVTSQVRQLSPSGNIFVEAMRGLAAMNRPFRRIAIQGSVAGVPTTIDVSTKHFVGADIRRLVHSIQEARPDLAVPQK